MQAATIAINLASANEANSPASFENKPVPGGLSFAETLANKAANVAGNEPAGSPNPYPSGKPNLGASQTLPVASSMGSAQPAGRGAAKIKQATPDESSPKTVQANATSDLLAATLPVPLNPNVPAEFPNPIPQIGAPAVATGPQSADATHANTSVPKAVVLPGVAVPLEMLDEAPNATPAAGNANSAIAAGIENTQEASPETETGPSIAAFAPKSAVGQVAALPREANPDPPAATPAPNGAVSGAAAPPTQVNPDPGEMLQNLLTGNEARGTNVALQQATQAASTQPPQAVDGQASPASAPGMSTSPRNDARGATPTGDTAAKSQVQRAAAPVPVPLPATMQLTGQASASAGKPEAPAHHTEEKTTADAANVNEQQNLSAVGAWNAKANLSTAGSTPLHVAKNNERGNEFDSHNGGSQDASSQKDTNAMARGADASSEGVPSQTSPAPDAKPASAPQAAAANGTAQQPNANLAVDATANNANAATNPLVNEHFAGQAAHKDTAAEAMNSEAPAPPVRTANSSPPNETRVVTSAQITGNMAQSEIHLAMQADKLGAVELHAQVAGGQVGAAIVVEKKETHAALAVELPELQQALAEKNLRVEHIWLTQGALHATAGDAGHSAGQQPRNHPGSRYVAEREEGGASAFVAGTMEPEGIFDERGHLSVRV